MAEELHVLFGGGQVGHPLSQILLGCGKRVRIVKRSASGLPDGVELVGEMRRTRIFVSRLRGERQPYTTVLILRITRECGRSCYRDTWTIL